ncbi:MAG: SynChlorMet cassette radical SAM/SPASM protein ScmE [Syntrophobacteraceae bacterium]|jgi:SynChlorMet cassette radical SAM/SPASM protein ScmE|nr:SynChlorMet cassette radical SAM/SPASM protein ScmE [Syntrophobacteraceae bacterium]
MKAVQVMRMPRSVDLNITTRCNLRCSYCFHFGSAGEVAGDLPTDEWLNFIAELGRASVMDVCVGGGEPFLRPDIMRLISAIVCRRMRFSILTNGTLITREVASFLAETGRCNAVQVSLDGSSPDPHDACRGEGSFHRALRGLQCLREQAIPVTVRVTIHRHNIADMENIAHLLLEELKLPCFSTNAASYMGLCRENVENLQLTVEERTEAMKCLMSLVKRYGKRISATAGPLAEAQLWTEMESARLAGKAQPPDRGYLMACGAVMRKMAVRPDGAMVPCSHLSHLVMGRINRDDFVAIWQNHPELQRLRQRVDTPLSTFAFCNGCGYIPYCTGNCPALAYNYLGVDHHPSPDACLKRFLEAGGSLPQWPL